MKLMSALRIDVADLLTHPGARRPLHVEAAVADLGGTAARVDEPVVVDLVLERVPDGLVAGAALGVPMGPHGAAPASRISAATSGKLRSSRTSSSRIP